MLKKKSYLGVLTILILLLITIVPNPLFSAGCFKEFENCMANVRTSFLGGFIDALDCEAELVSCLVHMVK
ncbi:MAG: hypothetical protein IBX60_02940 [Candidatus Aminicenantes bacterium]|nr:hypothetical protein [Candidatus Aminicenantes bacterium]